MLTSFHGTPPVRRFKQNVSNKDSFKAKGHYHKSREPYLKSQAGPRTAAGWYALNRRRNDLGKNGPASSRANSASHWSGPVSVTRDRPPSERIRACRNASRNRPRHRGKPISPSLPKKIKITLPSISWAVDLNQAEFLP